MRRFFPLLLLAFALLLVACGGGGGGGGGSSSDGGSDSGGSTGGLTSVRAEAVLAGNPSQPVDPKNIQVGENVQFQVVGYDSNRNRVVIASSNWTTTDVTNSAGTLTSGGFFTAQNSTSGVNFTASANAQGKQYNMSYAVKPVQALVTGTVMDSNGFPVSRAEVRFYNASGSVVSRVVTAYNGVFRASVPTNAVKFNLDPNTLPLTFFFRTYSYDGKRYTALEPTCGTPLPPLGTGATTILGTIRVDARFTNNVENPPPPPPDGC